MLTFARRQYAEMRLERLSAKLASLEKDWVYMTEGELLQRAPHVIQNIRARKSTANAIRRWERILAS